MKSSFSPFRSSGFIEPLESRVAPAVIYIGYPAGGSQQPTFDTQYDTGTPGNPDNRGPGFDALHFVATYSSSDLISQAVNEAGVDNTYYLLLTKGDTVLAFNGSQGYTPIINVTGGNVVAFFTDINNDDRYEAGELTGLALGKNASIQLGTSVNGDVVTALNDSSKIPADYTIDTAGLVSNTQGITKLSENAGSIFGNVLSGGNITNLSVSGNVNNVLAGTAANGTHYDFFQLPDPANAGQFLHRFTVNFTEPVGQTGSSISNTQIQSLGENVTTMVNGQPVTTFVPGILQAGDGGSGGKGGPLSNVWINDDGNAFSLLAGNGGDGIAGKTAGGAGGSLLHITVSGVSDPTVNAQINLEAGHGGDAFGTSSGGAGGTATDVFVGYDLFGTTPVNSTNLSSDNVLVESGAGGAGKTGGKGGLLSNINLRVSTPVDLGDELSLIAGVGGTATSALAGAAGAGGALQHIQVLNEIATPGSEILLQAGNGGTATGLANGAAGGAISSVSLLGYDFQALAGDGSSGKTGGAGGAISAISVLQGVDILNQVATFSPGFGGNGSTGNGGKGGAISNINVPVADYTSFLIDPGTQGNGGNSTGGKGGVGGSVSSVSMEDIDGDPGVSAATLTGVVAIRGGNGGNGAKGGGAGGSLGGSTAGLLITGFGLSMTASAGLGGDATVSGAGGSGGAATAVNLTALDNLDKTNQNGLDVTASITSGAGGDGMVSGKGGNGGAISFVNLDTDGQASLIAGDGGDGQAATGSLKGSAPGSGGTVSTTGVFANNSSGLIQAGNAGLIGVGAAAGGSLIGGKSVDSLVGLRAETAVTLLAGDGSGGGAGGNIINATYGSSAASLSPTPSGNIMIMAGNGSGAGKLAGSGGVIEHLSGSVTSGPGALTSIQAGDGGSTDTASGAGGSVSDVTILSGGAPQAIFTIAAGDAGNAPDGKKGAAGGSVNGVQVSNLDAGLADPTDLSQQTIFRSVAAGDGGSVSTANGTGGAGGSINGVFVSAHDIGVRTGAAFGYDSAGGLFAGLGGAGLKPGLNGDVTNIQANAIASIVAGRTLNSAGQPVPQEATNVNHIYVNDNSVLLTAQSLLQPGAFTLTYNGDSTPLLGPGATVQQVQLALNTLASIAADGGVTVTSGSTPGTYIVLFDTTGAKMTLAGVEQIPETAAQLIAGEAPVSVPLAETTMGTQALNVPINQNGEFNLGVAATVVGEIDFSAIETVQGNPITGVDQVESIDLRNLANFPTSTFSLTFDGATTPDLLASTNANAPAIAAALNALPSIMNVGGVEVAPATGTSGTFLVTFVVPGQVDEITGTKLLPEVQQLNLGAVTNSQNGTFTLTFAGQTTNPLLSTASASDIASALNGLSSIPAGGVAVNPAGPAGAFNIVFQSNGSEPLISGVGDVSESQTLDLNSVQSFASQGANVVLSFNGQTSTTPLPVTASATDISNALNALSSIPPGGVTVTQTGAHAFAIVFAATGEQPAIGANANVLEVENLDVSSVDHVATGQFSLSFGASTTSLLPGNATAAQIQAQLNSLPDIIATGPNGTGGAVTVAAAGPDHFSITFNTVGEESLIGFNGQINELQEIQVLTPKNSTGGTFTLSYNGQTTAALPDGATAAQVAAALNGLSTIPTDPVAGVGVTVTSNTVNGVTGIYDITFVTAGAGVVPPAPQLPINQITSLQMEPMTTVVTGGTGSTDVTETISVLPKGAFDPVKFANADLVGSIYNINAIDANVFHYIDNNPNDATFGQIVTGNFQLGDTPIDGIVMAKNFDQSTVNFTPEAELINNSFFDYLNQ